MLDHNTSNQVQAGRIGYVNLKQIPTTITTQVLAGSTGNASSL